LLELLLIIANIGTAVVIVPIVRRQNEELATGYVTARLFECTFILVGIVSLLGIVTLRNQAAGASEGTVAYTLAAIKDWTFLLGPGWVVGWGERADPRLPEVPLGPGSTTRSMARTGRRAADHHLRQWPCCSPATTRATGCDRCRRS
jgi:hypothetical protein